VKDVVDIIRPDPHQNHVAPDEDMSGLADATDLFVTGQRYAMHGARAMVLVNVMRIPCFGRRMTIGRASIVWPGAS
jgi:hypothetical protein